MPARDLLKQLKINIPCSANWDAMIGNERVRFCEHCQLSVNDLTALTPKHVRRLIAKADGRLCVRYYSGHEGKPLINQVPKKLHQINKRVSRLAAGMFTATLGLSNASSQPATTITHERVFAAVNVGSAVVPVQMSSAIRGKITDITGSAIEGAGISLTTAERTFLSGTITNAKGEYSFEGLLPGRYSLTIEAHGFKTLRMTLAMLSENESLIVDRSLEAESLTVEEEERFVTVGAVAINTEPEEPLVAAARADDLQALEALLTRDNVNVRYGNDGNTSLDWAVRNGNKEMVQVLLSAGADVNSQNISKQTALMMLGEETTADIVWDLVHAGAKLDLQDDEGDTALMEVAQERNSPALTALLHAGAKVDARNEEGQTALMLAAQSDQLANIRALIRNGADLNAQDKDGWTTLDYALSSDRERIVKLLLSYGAVTGKRKAK